MSKRLLLVGLMILVPLVVLAQSNPKINYVPAGSETPGLVPGGFTAVREGVFALIDPLNYRLVLINGAGKTLGASAPLPFAPDIVRKDATSLYLINSQTGKAARAPLSLDPSNINLSILDSVPSPASPLSAPVRTRMGLELRSASGQKLIARAQGGGKLVSAKILGEDFSGTIYVETDELIAPSPIKTQSYVLRYSPEGMFTGVARAPTELMETVPAQDVALQPSGAVTAIVPTDKGLYLKKLRFTLRRRGNSPIPAGGAALVPIEANIQTPDRGTGLSIPVPAAPERLTKVSRSRIIQRAEDYLHLKWTLQEVNYAQTGIENHCDKSAKKYWARPNFVTKDRIGKEIERMPYKWGGGDTPETFLSRIASGALAGSVCTCRDPSHNDCLVAEAAGVDCSGFISGVWGIRKAGTATLSNYSTELKNPNLLKQGDILNNKGHHVRLFAKFGDEDSLHNVLYVYESATRPDCQGVCYKRYELKELQRYRPLQFKAIMD